MQYFSVVEDFVWRICLLIASFISGEDAYVMVAYDDLRSLSWNRILVNLSIAPGMSYTYTPTFPSDLTVMMNRSFRRNTLQKDLTLQGTSVVQDREFAQLRTYGAMAPARKRIDTTHLPHMCFPKVDPVEEERTPSSQPRVI